MWKGLRTALFLKFRRFSRSCSAKRAFETNYDLSHKWGLEDERVSSGAKAQLFRAPNVGAKESV
jgi:hypothetical protein